MVPVREGFASTNQGAINAVTKLYDRGVISRNYALPHKDNGKSYYGRGHVQLTWRDNYRKMGDRLDIPLEDEPDLALDFDIGADITVIGMAEGLFTGKRLHDYFNDTKTDPRGARRIVNGTDKAALIATYYERFLPAIKFAHFDDASAPLPEPKPDTDAEPKATFWSVVWKVIRFVFSRLSR